MLARRLIAHATVLCFGFVGCELASDPAPHDEPPKLHALEALAHQVAAPLPAQPGMPSHHPELDPTSPDEPKAEGECVPDSVPTPNEVLREPPGLEGCLPGMARISGTRVCIDRWEAHLVVDDPDGTTRAWSPYSNPANEHVRAMSAPGAVPQGYINQLQAARACAASGKRLCTRWQWTRACRGEDNKRRYPYGNVHLPGACNDHREKHPLIELFGSPRPWTHEDMGHPCLNQMLSTVAKAGTFESCRTPDNVYDLVGNLHEWTDDPKGTFLGGFFVDTRENGKGCGYATVAHGVKHWDYSTGFRCCAYR